MRRFPLLPALLFWLGLLQVTPFSHGSLSPAPKRRPFKAWSNAATTSQIHPAVSASSVTQQQAVDIDADTGRSVLPVEEEPQPSQLVSFLKGQKIVMLTSIVVAISAGFTKNVAWQKLRTHCLAGTVIFMVGDWSAQLLTHVYSNSNTGSSSSSSKGLFLLDNNRFVISAILGVLWAGICNPACYAMVENLLPGASSVGRVLLKMCISISILSTAGNYGTMVFRRLVKQLWETTPRHPLAIFRDVVQSCNQDFMEVLKDDLKVWPLCDTICFALMPPTVRPITNALMASAWSMYVSIASAKTQTTTFEEVETVKFSNGEATEETKRVMVTASS